MFENHHPFRRTLVLLLVGLSILVGLISCGVFLPNNSKPTIVVVSPPSNDTVTLDQIVHVQFVAQDADGIARVDLSVDGETLTLQNPTPSSPTFTGVFNWTPQTAGSHMLTLQAYGTSGMASGPAGIVLLVTESTAVAATSTSAAVVIPTTTSIPSVTLMASATPPTVPSPTPLLPTVPSPTSPPPTVPTPTLSPTVMAKPTITATPSPLPKVTPPTPNRPPVISALVIGAPNVPARSSVTVSVVAADPDTDSLGYQWFVDAGPRADLAKFLGNGANVLFQSPTVPSGVGVYSFRVVVYDGRGGTSAAIGAIAVIPPSGLGSAGPDFFSTWSGDRSIQDRLGFALTPESVKPTNSSNPPAAEEAFRSGYMFWFKEDYDGAARIYVIYSTRPHLESIWRYLEVRC